MDTLFVVKTVDVSYAALDVKQVGGWFSAQRNAPFFGKDVVPMNRTAKGTFTLGPVDALEFQVFVEHPNTFPIHEKLFFQPDPKPEKWEFLGFPDFYSRNRSTNSRDGGGLVVELVVVISSMRVADNDVEAIRASFSGNDPRQFIHSSQPFNCKVRSFNTPILTGTGTGEDRLSFTNVSFRADQLKKVRYIESKGYPQLIACYDPVKKAAAQGNTPASRSQPINYHVFLHPSTGHFGNDPYPFGRKYLDLISRYILVEGKTFVGHGVAVQHQAARPNNTVAVYPVGSASKWHQGLNTQSGMLRLVQELHWVLQRADGERFPQQPIGGIAISGFSASIDFISQCLRDPGGAMIKRGLLREVYSFDGFHGQGSDAEAIAFLNAAASFVKADPVKRSFRAYSQNPLYLSTLSSALTATRTTGPAGAVELESDSFTLLFAPTNFWTFVPIVVANKNLFEHVHQTIPAFFMQHARSKSRL